MKIKELFKNEEDSYKYITDLVEKIITGSLLVDDLEKEIKSASYPEIQIIYQLINEYDIRIQDKNNNQYLVFVENPKFDEMADILEREELNGCINFDNNKEILVLNLLLRLICIGGNVL